MLTLAASIILCFLALWLLLGALACLLYPLLRKTVHAIDPAQASRLMLTGFALPAVIAGLTCATLYLPDISTWLVAGHCHLGDCRQHGPVISGAALPAALFLLWTAWQLAAGLRSHWLPARRLKRQLSALGQHQGDYVLLESNRAAAFTVGWWQPTVFVTTGLRATCPPTELDCILQHERAHRQRRDNARLLAARLLTQPLPRRWTQAMLDDFKLYCERASDEYAGRLLSREAVAQALLRTARLQRDAVPAGALAFAGDHTEQRVLALLREPAAPLGPERVLACAAAMLLLLLAIANPLHGALELIP